jgi:hypothetical protein
MWIAAPVFQRRAPLQISVACRIHQRILAKNVHAVTSTGKILIYAGETASP